MVAILYLEVKLLRKNSKKYHARQNARKPRKTAKNKHYLTTVKNTVKPLISRVIQQPRWRRNAPNRQTRTKRVHAAATECTPHRNKHTRHTGTEQTGSNSTHTKHHAPHTPHGTGTTSPRNSTTRAATKRTQKSAAPPPQKRGQGDAHAHRAKLEFTKQARQAIKARAFIIC